VFVQSAMGRQLVSRKACGGVVVVMRSLRCNMSSARSCMERKGKHVNWNEDLMRLTRSIAHAPAHASPVGAQDMVIRILLHAGGCTKPIGGMNALCCVLLCHQGGPAGSQPNRRVPSSAPGRYIVEVDRHASGTDTNSITTTRTTANAAFNSIT
jgi:hypothetical protein